MQKVVSGLKLRSSVARKRGRQFLWGDARAVVHDLNRGSPRIQNRNMDVRCTCIQGIFHQFFDDGGRTLDNFARRNLVGDLFMEVVNGWHQFRGREESPDNGGR